MNYKLEDDRLRRLGFPMESELHPGKACVYQDPEFGSRSLGEVDDDDYRDDEQRSRYRFSCSVLKSAFPSLHCVFRIESRG